MKTNRVITTLRSFTEEYLPQSRGLSVNTITSYKKAYALFFQYLNSKNILPDKVTYTDLQTHTIPFLDWIENERGCSRKTRNQRLAAISSFAKYAMIEDFANAGAFASCVLNIPNKKVSQTPDDDVVYFLPEELSIILRLPNTETATGRRDLTLLSFLYGSGARAQECCDLTINDVVFAEKTFVRLKGKGGKTRRIVLIEESAALLKSYMKSKGMLSLSGDDRKRHVFSSQRNEHMSISCIEEIVAKYVRIAKREHPDKFIHKTYTPHCFRHTIAVDMLQSGCSLPAIKSFLGHASIQSTQIYATVTASNANKALRDRELPVTIPKTNFSENTADEDILAFLK